MKPQLNRNDSHLAYLEPPHLHDPASVSDIASLPTSTLRNLPDTVQLALYNLQQSTSIVYASFIRLQEMLDERFERLNPTLEDDGEITFSESYFFNYVNSLSAERTYLLSDAHPDWRHKAFLARVEVEPYYDVLIEPTHVDDESPHNVLLWWEYLQQAVASWCDYARTVHIPDYEDTIGEYQAARKHEPALLSDADDSPLETPLATPTPILEPATAPFDCCEIEGHGVDSSILHSKAAVPKLNGLGLDGTFHIGGMGEVATHEFALKDEGQVRDERKDSGVGFNS